MVFPAVEGNRRLTPKAAGWRSYQLEPSRIFAALMNGESTMKVNTTNTPRMATFADFIRPISHYSDSLDHMVGTLSDCGMYVMNDPDHFFQVGDDDAYDAFELGVQMQWYGGWLEAKGRGYAELRDHGTEAVKAKAQYKDTVEVVINGQHVTGEFYFDGFVIYVFLGDECEVIPPHQFGTAAMRRARNKESAEHALRCLHANGPVTLLCRPLCSFKPLSVRRRPGFSILMLSACDADCRSR